MQKATDQQIKLSIMNFVFGHFFHPVVFDLNPLWNFFFFFLFRFFQGKNDI